MDLTGFNEYLHKKLPNFEKHLPKEGTIAYRLLQILGVILIIIGGVIYLIFRVILIVIWLLTVIIDVILFFPCCLLWIFTGEFYAMKLSDHVYKKFKLNL